MLYTRCGVVVDGLGRVNLDGVWFMRELAQMYRVAWTPLVLASRLSAHLPEE